MRRQVTDRGDLVARGSELGLDLAAGGAVVVVRAPPLRPDRGRLARARAVRRRARRALERPGSLAALLDGPSEPIAVLLPATEEAIVRRVADAIVARADRRPARLHLRDRPLAGRPRPGGPLPRRPRGAAGRQRRRGRPADDAGHLTALAFEDTGAYRLLLPAMSEDPAELQRFYEETVAPLVAYDEQYGPISCRRWRRSWTPTATWPARRSGCTPTATRCATGSSGSRPHGLDVSSTDGRERLGLGLKAMRVLGITSPRARPPRPAPAAAASAAARKIVGRTAAHEPRRGARSRPPGAAPPEQEPRGGRALGRVVLVDRGQIARRRLGQVVEAGHREVLRHAQAELGGGRAARLWRAGRSWPGSRSGAGRRRAAPGRRAAAVLEGVPGAVVQRRRVEVQPRAAQRARVAGEPPPRGRELGGAAALRRGEAAMVVGAEPVDEDPDPPMAAVEHVLRHGPARRPSRRSAPPTRRPCRPPPPGCAGPPAPARPGGAPAGE